MEELRTLLGESMVTSLAIGLGLSAVIPLGIVPLTAFIKRGKRSINWHLEIKGRPDNYAFVVTRTIVMSGAATGVFLQIAAKSDHILWSLTDATPATLIKTFAGCFLLREFFAYWSHRFFHSKLLYKRFHAEHHAISQSHDNYDGYYIDFYETAVAAFVAYLPALFIMHQVHVIAVIIFQVFAAFFVFSMNHCGRDVQITFNCFGYAKKPLVLYAAQYHDDHHVYRRGNYAELLPILDTIFGTAIVIPKRQPLPAQKLWKKAQKVRTGTRVAAAFSSAGDQGRVNRPDFLQKSKDSIRRSSIIEIVHLLCEEDDACHAQLERCKDKEKDKASDMQERRD